MPRRSLALGGAAAVALAMPAAASAAVTGTLDKPCYTHVPTRVDVPINTITVNLTGGTPGAGYVLSATKPGTTPYSGTAGSTSGNFDPAGNAVAQITNVSPPSGTIGPSSGQQVQLSVKDYGLPTPVDQPLPNATITNLGLNVATKPVSPRAHRQVSVSGGPFANQNMYGFIVRGSKSSHVLRRVSLGKSNACGFASKKVVVAPRSLKFGTYRLYVNAGTKLNKSLAIYKQFTIFRRFL